MIKDFIENNKKIIIIVLVLILSILISIYFIINSKESSVINNENIVDKGIKRIVLFGEKTITINQGDKYIEPGYYALTNDGEIKQEEIEVTGDNINTDTPGEYYISYTIKDKLERRKIIVKEVKKEENKDDSLQEKKGQVTLTLKGESMMVLKVNETYIEPGYSAIDTIDGDITNKIDVKGYIDTSKVGTYEIVYSIENSTKQKVTKTRTIIVKNDIINVNINGNVNNYTNKNITININIVGENYNYIKLPDGTVSKNKQVGYEITKNGTYTFLIYDLDNNYIKRQIKVDKIDKEEPIGSCTATIKDGKTNIISNVKDNLSGINNYKYFGDSKEIKNGVINSFVYNGKLNNIYINVFDNAGNSSKIICRIINESEPVKEDEPTKVNPVIQNDYLEMHFIVSGYNDDAILIRSGLSTILIDSGRYNAYKKVIPYLQDLGIKSIDAIIGSHPHYNHIQAQAKVIETFNVKSSYYPVNLNTCASQHYCESNDVLYIKDALKKYNIPMNVKSPGDTITIGDINIYIIGPYKLNSSSKYMQNENSFIFVLKYKNNTFMFTGDAGTSTFNYNKLKPYADKLNISLDIDMLKYPHHGNSNLEDNLLNAMTPKYVIIPNYNYTSYPNSSNKSKLNKIGASIYQNGRDGNIVLKSDGNNITIKKNQSASNYRR